MKTSNYLFVWLIALFSSGSVFAGGPWLFPQKSGFVQLQATIPAYRYDSLLMGTIRDVQALNRPVFNSDFNLYAEFGITDNIDIIAMLPAKYVSTSEALESQSFSKLLPEGSLFGLSNAKLGIKYGLLDKKIKAAVSFQASFNTVSRDAEKGLATGYDANIFGLYFHVGGSITPKLYMFAEAGYNLFTGGYSDLLDVHLEVGYRIWKPFSVIFTIDSRISIRNGSLNDERLIQTGLYPNNQESIVGSVKFVLESTSGYGVMFGTALIPIYMKYIGFAGAFTVGAFKKW